MNRITETRNGSLGSIAVQCARKIDVCVCVVCENVALSVNFMCQQYST